MVFYSTAYQRYSTKVLGFECIFLSVILVKFHHRGEIFVVSIKLNRFIMNHFSPIRSDPKDSMDKEHSWDLLTESWSWCTYRSPEHFGHTNTHDASVTNNARLWQHSSLAALKALSKELLPQLWFSGSEAPSTKDQRFQTGHWVL